MKLLEAYVDAEQLASALAALSRPRNRAIAVAEKSDPDSAHEALLFGLARAPRLGSRVIKVEAVCEDDEADRSLAAVSAAARSDFADGPVVLVTPWSGPGHDARTELPVRPQEGD